MFRPARLLGSGLVAGIALACALPGPVIPIGAESSPVALPSRQLAQAEPPGISLDVLGRQEIPLEWRGNTYVELLLERVPLDVGATLDGRDPDASGGGQGTYISAAQSGGAHLLYVESGEGVIDTPEEETAYRAGETTFVPAPPRAELDGPASLITSYDLRNDSGSCASVLRLSVYVVPGQIGGVPAAPSGPQRGCGEYELLFHNPSPYPWPDPPPQSLPAQMFLAELAWTEEAFLADRPVAYDGPMGLTVAAGRFTMIVGGRERGVRAEIPRGGQVGIDTGVSIMGWGVPGTRVLAMGVVPADTDWLVFPPQSDAVTPAPAAFPPDSFVLTTEDRVRLRAAPSTSSAIVAVLPRGTALTVTGPPEEGDGIEWYPVIDADQRTGYVAGTFLAAPGA